MSKLKTRIENWWTMRNFNKFVYQHFSEKIKLDLDSSNKRCLEDQFYHEIKLKYRKMLINDEDFETELCLLESNLNTLYSRSKDSFTNIGTVLFSFLGVILVFFKDIFKDLGILLEGYLNLLLVCVTFTVCLFIFIFRSQKLHEYYCNKIFYYELSLKVVKNLQEKKEKELEGEEVIENDLKYIMLFNNFQNGECKKDKYNELKTLYEHISDYYIDKISRKEIDSKIEKIVLENKLGKHNGESFKFNTSLLIGIVCTLIPLYLQSYVELSSKYKALLMLSSVVIAFFVVVKSIGKDITHDRDNDVVFNISIRVLDDIEKRANSNVRTLNEVAITNNRKDEVDIKPKSAQKS